MTSKLLKSFLLLCFLSVMVGQANAQSIADYIIQESSGVFVPNTSPAGTVDPADDEGQLNFYMPFDFTFDNTLITYVHMNSNGFVTLNYNWESTYNNPYFGGPSPGSYPMVIAGVSADMGVQGFMNVQLNGTAPNRVVVCEWSGISFYYGNGSCTFQIKFYEGSNIIEIVSGGYNIPEEWYSGSIYVAGAVASDYINIEPGSPSTFYRGNNSTNFLNQASSGFVPSGKTYRFLGLPLITGVNPKNGDILMKGGVYTQTQSPQFCPSVDVQRVTGQPDIYVRYSIGRNVPVTNDEYQIIYQAVNEVDQTDPLVYMNPQPLGSPARAFFTEAIGIASETPTDNGGLDLSTFMTSIPGGEYFVDAQLEIPALNYVHRYDRQLFNIALANDLNASSLLSPRQNNIVKYPTNTRVPVIADFKNTGFNAVNSFSANARIYFGNETTPLYNETMTWTSSAIDVPLTTGVSRTLTFPEYLPTRGVGSYRVEVTCTLLNPAPDLDLTNNMYPRTGSNFFFDIAYDLELEAYNIYTPASTISLGRPLVPQGQVRNLGISDIPYQVPARLTISKVNGDVLTQVYYSELWLDAVPAFPSGVITNFFFEENFTPEEAGNYVAVLTIVAMDDPILSNNTFTKTFTVLPGLTGTYTIGSIKPGIDVNRNYLTIESAVEDLYLKGMSGSIVYEFTDKNYTVNGSVMEPAIDLSSTIIGNNATNTITFRPNAVNSLNSGDVVIRLNSFSGIGVLIGQHSAPSNSTAAIYSVLPSLRKEYSNSMGYIKFDGGSNTSLKFVLNTASDFKACFYLGQGASNNTIKNCIIEDGSTNADYTTLPMTRYNASNREFEFEADNNANGTYSAGIVMRSIAPYDAKQFMLGKLENPYKLDTLSNDNNIISNNTISGFGYGIVSLGIGVLEKVEQGIGVHKKFYNTGNEIKNNTIYNVNRAGLFLGFEHNSLIEGNRIYNVFNLNGSGAVGIMAGSDPLNNYFGYNNIGLKINANEISGVNTNLLGAGISVTQSQNSYPNVSSSEFVTFPDVAETMVIANNAIWGFVGQTAADQKAGIVLQTGRASDNFSPAVATYRTRNDVIANNTIIMNEDGLASGADIYGMLIEQTENTKIVNNAIAISDNTYSSDNVSALLCYYGELPKAANVVFDRNVYWSTSTTNTDLARLIEAKSDASVLQVSKDGDIRNLGQWQIMTEQDANSTMYNFINDVMVTTTNKLRIKTSPSLPIGSKLNNNGYRFNEIVINDNTTLLDKIAQTDLTGILRGVAGTRVDIGALEFTGEVRHRDLEVVQITSPAVYKSALGEFSDNQYVMTTAPVEIKALLRNNGNYPQNNVTVMAVVYRQWPDGQYENGGLVIADTFLTYVNIASYDNVEVNFNTASGEGYDFVPETYSDLRTAAYTAPVKYGQMVTNVTPIYKIVVSVETDMDNTNNNKAESYRFYIKRSTLNMLVSAENITADKGSLTLTNDQLAGRLNYDSLKKAINRLGWYQETMTEPKDYHFDAFDRNVWEPKAVNYAMYKNLFWSDGDDKSIARQTEKDIRSFISNGANGFKKNLVVASQEMLRMNLDKSDFTQNILKAVNKAPYSPLNGASYADHRVIGSALSIGKVETILSTGFTSGTLTDIEPNPALMGTPSTSSLTYAAYVFQTKDVSATDSLAGVATSELTQNVIYLGIDWRHWGNLDTLLRGITDYNTRNGSKIEVPIELIDFDAIALNNRVELSWSTASEINTDRFEIERALLSQSGMSNFSVIAEEVAAGNSASTRSYGPVIDRNVTGGATYVYRLRTIDLDGSSSLSDEVEVTIDAVNTLGTINPNPAASTVKLDFNANSDVVITIYDMNGKLVKEIFNGTASGNMNISFEVNDLATGSYTIVMQAGKEFYSRQLYVRK